MAEPNRQPDAAGPRSLSIPEAAARRGLGECSVWRELKAGRFPGVLIGARWVIDADRLERFLAGYEDAQGNRLVPEPPAVDVAASPAAGADWRAMRAALDLLIADAEAVAAPPQPDVLGEDERP